MKVQSIADMTTVIFDPLDFASEGQIKDAEKLLKEFDSAGEPKVRKAGDDWIVQGSSAYIINSAGEGFECWKLGQDGIKSNQTCIGWRNCKEYTEGKKAKVCKHVIACILFERKQ